MDVSSILNKTEYKTTEVFKDVPLQLDVGYLSAFDYTPIDLKNVKADAEYLKNITRDNAQLLFNQIFSLKTRQDGPAIVAELPNPTTPLPREKPLPKPKAETRWEQFAKAKGIQKRKKGRMVYDDETDSYKPRFGYKRANDDTKDWVIEVPQNADPMEDQYAKRMEEKKTRIEKNKKNQVKNLERASKQQNKTKLFEREKKSLKETLTTARLSTPSLGKFSKALPNESKLKVPNQRRKFDPSTATSKEEEEKVKGALNKVMKSKQRKEGVLNVDKAARMSKARQDRQNALAKRQGGGVAKRKGKGGKGRK